VIVLDDLPSPKYFGALDKYWIGRETGFVLSVTSENS